MTIVEFDGHSIYSVIMFEYSTCIVLPLFIGECEFGGGE